MRYFDYVLVTHLGFVLAEASVIITVNTKFGFWEPINKIHVLCVVLYPIYLSSVIYASVECNRIDGYCNTLWKICSMLYIVVTIAVWSFYYVKSKVLHTLSWNGKCKYERLGIVMIALMGLMGLGFFFLSIRGVHYDAFLMDEECHLASRPWIPVVWMLGDAALSILLLVLFLRPLTEIRKMLGDSPLSVAMLIGVQRLIKKNRNLLIVTVVVTLGVMVTIAVGGLCMRTVHYLCAMDRLVALQCITLTFSYDSQEYFYYRPCLFTWCSQEPGVDEELSSSETGGGRTMRSPSIIVMLPTIKRNPSESDSVCFELKNHEGQL